jgi:hypothetical protein
MSRYETSDSRHPNESRHLKAESRLAKVSRQQTSDITVAEITPQIQPINHVITNKSEVDRGQGRRQQIEESRKQTCSRQRMADSRQTAQQIADSRPQTADSRQQTADCKLQTTDTRYQTITVTNIRISRGDCAHSEGKSQRSDATSSVMRYNTTQHTIRGTSNCYSLLHVPTGSDASDRLF